MSSAVVAAAVVIVVGAARAWSRRCLARDRDGDDGWSGACLARYAAQSSKLGGCLLRRGVVLDAASAPDDDASGVRVLGVRVETRA